MGHCQNKKRKKIWGAMQLAFLYVKLLKQQNYENIQTYRGRTKYPNSCTIWLRKQNGLAKNQGRKGKSNDAKVQNIKKVGEILPYSKTPNIANTAQTITAIKGRPIQINNQIAISHKITFTTKGIEFLFSMHKDNKTKVSHPNK